MVAGPTYWANQASGFSQANLSSAQQAGVAFQVSASYTVRSLGYRRAGDAANYRADSIRLWRTSDGALLGTVTVPTTENVGGWHFYDLDTAVVLDTSHTYIVTIYSLAGQVQDYLAGDGPATVGSPLVKVSAAGRYSTTTSYPDSTTTAFAWTADVSDQSATTSSGGTGATPTDVDNALADWLSSSSSVNLHQADGLPWLTKTVVDAIKNATDALSHSGSGSSIDWIVALWKLAGNLTDLEYAAVRQFLKDGQARITGASGGGGSAFYGPGGTQVAAGVEEVLSQLSAIAGGLPAKVLQAGIGSLSPVDETDFTYELAWNVPADVYVVHFTDWPGQREEVDVAGVTWLPRVAWWAPLEGSQPGQRRFLDFEYNQAHQLPVRSEGMLLRAKYVGVAGHVQAFVLP